MEGGELKNNKKLQKRGDTPPSLPSSSVRQDPSGPHQNRPPVAAGQELQDVFWSLFSEQPVSRPTPRL